MSRGHPVQSLAELGAAGQSEFHQWRSRCRGATPGGQQPRRGADAALGRPVRLYSAGAAVLTFAHCNNGEMMSNGSGNTIVEFLSAAITVSVSR